jgi:hypothetical protein
MVRVGSAKSYGPGCSSLTSTHQNCLDITENDMAQHGNLEYLPDSQFVMISYAVGFEAV